MPRKEFVQQMFDDIAPAYDRLNHILSLDVDRIWRRHAIKEIADGTPQNVLDVACGTGDSTIAIARAVAEGSRVTGSDISEGMMGFVMEKAKKAGVEDRISVEQGDCEDLKYEDGRFDRVTCAFGVRNFEHKELGLKEMHRVLKPGGKVVILELSVPSNPLVRWFYGLYFKHLLPLVGGAVSGKPGAYRYLPASVYAFPGPAVFSRMLEEAGFSDVKHKSLSLGLCRMYTGKKDLSL